MAQSVGSLRRSHTSVVGVEADMPTSLKRRDCRVGPGNFTPSPSQIRT